MKSALIRVLFLLFAMGVFADAETVSVIEGESVTLHTGVAEILRDDDVEWRLNVKRIARFRNGSISTEGASRDRLQLDGQTGDLKITDIRTTDSGKYTLEISSARGTSEKIFSVSVVSGGDELKSVSVIEGDSVTLNSGTIIQRDDVIEWRFGDLNTLIAENNRKTGNFSTSDGPDGRFRDRLELDYTTGSLTIRKIEIKHSGFYEAVIRKSSSGHTIYKSYNVTASGEIKSILSVIKGKSVTLNSGLTDIQTDDLVWMFGHSQIAEIYKAGDRFLTSDGPDGRFRDRLKLDRQNGSLIITNTRTEDSGLYELKISSSRHTIYRRIAVSVTDPPMSAGAKAGIVLVVLLMCAALAAVLFYYRREISELIAWKYKMTMPSVIEGESITLTPDDVQKDDRLQWMFRSCCIAERKSGADSSTVYDDLPDERFKDRLKLDPQTGSLTIMNTKTTDSGVYELLITRPGKISIKSFRVSVFVKPDEIKTVSVKEGESIKLETGFADIQKFEQIQWKCGLNFRLAEIRGEIKKISPTAAKRLEVKLDLDRQTGSLTIKKIRPKDAGIYMLRKIDERGNITTKLFRVKVVSDPTDFRNNSEENVPLRSVP